MPPAEFVLFSLEVDRDGHCRFLAGGRSLHELCRSQSAVDEILRQAAALAGNPDEQERQLTLADAEREGEVVYCSLARAAGRTNGTKVEGVAVAARQPSSAAHRQARLREIEAFTALWAHVESTPDARARESTILGQLAALPEIAAVGLWRAAPAVTREASAGNRSPQWSAAAEAARRDRRTVIEPLVDPHRNETVALQFRVWLPVGDDHMLELVLEPGALPDSWTMELYEAYADLLALSGALAGEGAPGTGPGEDLAHLTQRQRDILYLLATESATNRDIARRLALAVPTVKVHLRSLLKRFGVGSRTELVRLVHERHRDWLEAERARREGGR